MAGSAILEIAVECDAEAAEAVSELFNRFNGGDYDADSEAGEASGGGAVIETTGYDDFGEPIDGQFRIVVKTYIKPGARGEQIRRQIEEGLWFLSRIYPIPEPQIRTLHEEDWAHAWKRFYKPLRVGGRILLKPSWESVEAAPEDIVIELDPGMAFGTGLHPSTRLCIAALEEHVRPGDAVLDLGTGSGVLAIAAYKLGAASVLATDIDPIAVNVARENALRNGVPLDATPGVTVQAGSVPEGMANRFDVIVANILAEVLVKLFDGEYSYPPLAEPLKPGGALILAGIIEERAEMVVEAARRHGCTLIDRKQEGDWVALVVRKA
ncbi:50S ribosomal protein L11 methyltransferase [Caldilinea sp.]|uniref:50S ribosomal protein L11 methyltransferase n=1 Tax=Caldilinea sp. TaxID=2293560 RepID=UPI0021DF1143|nr:50S ribosomal protein L11 methyltransferase [Caldilinea sp.]GIV67235.1 MAG: ribosomal protein L11 methyltransferase [Caldilinea sp.]